MKHLYQQLLLLIFIVLLVSNTIIAQTKINPNHVTIIRDSWGVPHIYGKTDADAAYGLAWACAEDNFELMQESLLAVRGMQGSVKGKDGALFDAIHFIVNPDKVVDEQFDTAFSKEFRKVLSGYVQGINRYAETHRKERLSKKLFPVTEKDIIKAYVTASALMTNLQYPLLRIFNNHVPLEKRPRTGGSNAIAMNKYITKDGKTYLAINSHQPLDGTYSWWEVHVNSEEGWNFLGATFPGGLTPFHGTNEHLGWAHTTNYPDYVDTYELVMHPTKKNHYQFDGEWLELEERIFKTKVKVGFLKIPVKRKFYWSKYGTTIKNKQGYFSLRFPANMVIGSSEQWYWMNKAQNFEEFKDALRMQKLPGINTIYADKEGNVYLLANGLFPDRKEGYNWKETLVGNTSDNLWQPPFLPFDSLIQIENPHCGYVYNMNHSEFIGTSPTENPKPKDYNKNIGYLTKDTGRSRRFQELMEEYTRVDWEEFKRIKYDQQLPNPLYTHSIENLEDMFHLSPEKYPDIAAVIALLSKWDRKVDVHNKQAPIVSLAIQYIVKYMFDNDILELENNFEEQLYVDALRSAQKHLLKHFGTLEIELGDLQKLVRGDKEYPLWGVPDAITAMYTDPYKDGKLKGVLGESHILLVRYGEEDGSVYVETIHSYGASGRKDSPHYDDQVEKFLKMETKPMSLKKEDVLKNAAETYHPQ